MAEKVTNKNVKPLTHSRTHAHTHARTHTHTHTHTRALSLVHGAVQVIDHASVLLTTNQRKHSELSRKMFVSSIESFYDIDAESADPRTREFLRCNTRVL